MPASKNLLNGRAVLKVVVLLLLVMMVLCSTGVRGQQQQQEDEQSICPMIIKRAQWGAERSTNVTYQLKPVTKVIIHHTTGDRCMNVASCKEMVLGVQSYHQKQNGWSDIGYNFLIGPAHVYEGIGWHRVGAHLRGHNSNSIGVAFLGNFDLLRPTPRSLEALDRLLECGVALGELTPNFRLHGASQLQSTNSPGKLLYAKVKEHSHWTRPAD
ncbi:peptidoglycan-recognition protein 2-like [Anopheles darlingi]|uniref:peptidoglycan-recognition protein 2-like n=1 Tax=Anopheles darlingi TaxID=43151 RepID=UPI0021003C2B|nr:peptidoglycan-recognition protein 2-like [Anopheles darlingi]